MINPLQPRPSSEEIGHRARVGNGMVRGRYNQILATRESRVEACPMDSSPLHQLQKLQPIAADIEINARKSARRRFFADADRVGANIGVSMGWVGRRTSKRGNALC